MQVKTHVVVERRLRLVSISDQCREIADQIDGLTEHVGNRSVVRIVIIAVQCQHASCHLVHDIVGWCSQNDISGKSLRKLSLGAKQLFKIFQLRPGRKRTEDQQICDFLKAKSFFFDIAVHQVFDAVTAVIQFPFYRDLVFLFVYIVTDYFPDFR